MSKAGEYGVATLGIGEVIPPIIEDYDPVAFERVFDAMFSDTNFTSERLRGADVARTWRNDEKIFAANALRRQRRKVKLHG